MLNSRENFVNFLEEVFKNKKYDIHNYMYHIFKVEQRAKKHFENFPLFWVIQLACLGHDVIEDTNTTKEDLEKYLSLNVIDIIDRVTDKKGKNRKERHLNTYPYIREKELAVIVKLCDRIENVEYSIKKQSKQMQMYRKEHDNFKFALFDPRHKLAKRLWDEYDNLFKRKRNENN